jgi:integrase/recombinase XerD
MNPKDIACLKYKNIQSEYIVFERSKTESALRRDPKPITVFVTDDMKRIIERWGNRNNFPIITFFPIMEQGISPLRQYELRQLFVSFINNWSHSKIQNG